jgi:hypothetical protein
MTKRYTRADFDPFIGDGTSRNKPQPLPNAVDADPLRFLNDLAARGHMMEPVWGYAMLPAENRTQWTQFFLLYDAMGGGGGYAVTYGGNKPIVRQFTICRHEKVMHSDARPEYGWRPGHCKHCGMDMSVDSSG